MGPDCQALPCVRRYSWWVRAVSDSNVFLAKYRGPFGGSQMSARGIIILRVIRRHFLACGRGPSCRPLHIQYSSDGSRSLTMLTMPRSVACMRPWAWCVPTVSLSCIVISDDSWLLTTLTTPRREHQGGGRRQGLGRGRLGAGEDAAVDTHAKRSTRVHWFGYCVRLLSTQNNRGCG